MRKRQVSEDDFLQPIRRLFRKNQYSFFEDVKVNDRRIDVVLLRKDNGRLIAVELKIKKWQRALEQAAVYQLFTNQVYVSLWHEYLNSRNIQVFKQYGIGVIVVEPTIKQGLRAEIIQNPKRTIKVNEYYAKEILKSLFELGLKNRGNLDESRNK